ncbi:MAG: inositol oxygenase family protein [Planctomycetota bacterium]|jgi:inositol oxygenase
MEEWEDDLVRRYPEPSDATTTFKATDPDKKEEDFRNYDLEARPSVREFYRLNHINQTLDFARSKRDEYLQFNQREMGIWEAMEYLNTLVDDSDPDTDLSQIQHLLQTAEGIRADGHPRWFILAGLIHDLGKILCLFGEPQWAVVGDTFPLGCRFAESIVYHRFFDENPDNDNPELNTRLGVYEENAGLDTVCMSWGHDEYLYHVVKDYMPEEALYMIRYHSFYPCHRENDYRYLMSDHDHAMFEWVRAFNPYDLYTKSHEAPDVVALRPYYEELIDEFFPAKIRW